MECHNCKHLCYDRMEIVKAVVGRSNKVKYKPQHYFKCQKGNKLESNCKDFEKAKNNGKNNDNTQHNGNFRFSDSFCDVVGIV